MKKGVLSVVLSTALLMLLMGCGGGSGGSDGSGSSGTSGTLSVAITDAKPKLPEDIEHVYVTFDEVQVHKAGGDWVSLPVVAPAPHRIDLFQFRNGNTTELVPPVKLESGKYTQIRIIVSDAWFVTAQGEKYDLQVPSGKLRTDKNFDFEVHGGGAVDLVVDFDLSQSIVAQGNGIYKLKPVLHLVDTLEAATIRGTIPAAAFGSTTEATVIVWWDKTGNCTFDDPAVLPPDDPDADEIYTEVVVPQTDPEFEIFWLVPNESYIVQIKVGGNEFLYMVPGPDANDGCQKLQPGVIYDLGSATIQGAIKATTFVGSTSAVVTVLFDPDGDGVGDASGDDKAYTTLTLVKPAAGDATFSIPVVRSQAYVVQVETDGDPDPEYQEDISVSDWTASPTFPLHGGAPI